MTPATLKLNKRLDYFEELHARLESQVDDAMTQLIRVEYAYYKTLNDLSDQRILDLCRTGR